MALTEHLSIFVTQSCRKQTTDETIIIINMVLMGHRHSQLFFSYSELNECQAVHVA